MTDQTKEELPEFGDEARAGRGFPFSMLGDFVALADIPDKSKLIYWVLRMHVNQEAGTNKARPLRSTLAELIGLKPGRKADDAVTKYVRPLQEITAVDIEIHRYGTNLMKRRNIYVVHLRPHEAYAGLASLKEYYALRAQHQAGSTSS